MGYLNEYIEKGYTPAELLEELQRLVEEYNMRTGRYLYLYVAAMSKPINGISLEEDDFYIIRDMLEPVANASEIDFYIETPGGNGVTAEQIANFLHDKYDRVNFVISGEAKSAGTILVMSGNDILMTKTGSLGPIDAQIVMGRTVVSAYDYMEWIDKKMEEAEKRGKLNPVDATMIAQITPGEIQLVKHALEYAKDLVKKWLEVYKFEDWIITEKKKCNVTKEMKQKRAEEIAEELANHSRWRTHSRSLGIQDLESIGLKIIELDNDKEIADLVYRIQFVCKLLQESTSMYKLFFSKDERIIRNTVMANIQNKKVGEVSQGVPSNADVVCIDVACKKCGRKHRFYKNLTRNTKVDDEMKRQNMTSIMEEDTFVCECGSVNDLKAVKNELDMMPGIR